MMLTLMLAMGMLVAPEPQAEPQKGWVVEVRGYTYHRQAKPDVWIFECLRPQAEPQVDLIEAIYIDDLRAFFRQLQKH